MQLNFAPQIICIGTDSSKTPLCLTLTMTSKNDELPPALSAKDHTYGNGNVFFPAPCFLFWKR